MKQFTKKLTEFGFVSLISFLPLQSFADSYSTLFYPIHKAIHLHSVEKIFEEICSHSVRNRDDEYSLDCFTKSRMIEAPEKASNADLKKALSEMYDWGKHKVTDIQLTEVEIKKQIHQVIVKTEVSQKPEVKKLEARLVKLLIKISQNKGTQMFEMFSFSNTHSGQSISIVVYDARHNISEVITLTAELVTSRLAQFDGARLQH